MGWRTTSRVTIFRAKWPAFAFVFFFTGLLVHLNAVPNKFQEVQPGRLPEPFSPVHLAFTCDASDPRQARLLGAAVKSILRAASRPERLHFHLLVGNSAQEALIGKLLRCTLNEQPRVKVNTYDLRSQLADLPILVRNRAESRLENPLNYARFFLADVMPSIDKVLYLDTDILVLSDVSSMYDEYLVHGDKAVAAASREQKLSSFVNLDEPVVQGVNIPANTSAFNAGVLLIRLDHWRRRNLTECVLFWMHENKRTPIFKLGSQPPLLLCTVNNYERMDPMWNVAGAGYKAIDKHILSRAKLIHWTGAKKGNEESAFHHDIWSQHDSPECFHEIHSESV